MRNITLKVSTVPIPKGRPRFHISRRGQVHTFTPDKTSAFEYLIAQKFKEQSNSFKFERDIPLKVSLFFGMPIPMSTTKRRKAAMLDGVLKHTKKPDLDNLIKAVLDALNDVAWEDDSQIIRVAAEKEYSEDPYVYIKISESVD